MKPVKENNKLRENKINKLQELQKSYLRHQHGIPSRHGVFGNPHSSPTSSSVRGRHVHVHIQQPTRGRGR